MPLNNPTAGARIVRATMNAVGFTAPLSTDVVFSIFGGIVTMYGPLFFGTSNSVNFTLQGLPDEVQPLDSIGPYNVIPIFDNGNIFPGFFEIVVDEMRWSKGVGAGGVFPVAPGGFTAAGDKGYPAFITSWPVDASPP